MIISITGKSGSGKSFLAQNIAPLLGAKIIHFDDISHEVLTHEDVLHKIRAEFGDIVFDKNQKLNRKKLGKIAFGNAEKLKFLNSLAEAKMEKIIDNILANSNNNFILDYALLPKMKYFNLSDCKILINANPHTRKTRIVSRDKIDPDYFAARDTHSLDYDERLFDIVIENNDNLNFEKITQIIQEVLCSKKQ